MPEPDSHPFKKFFGRHWELFAALTSGLVGALALGTSTYNVYLQRQQVRASVWPHVTMDTSSGDDGAVSLMLRNRGVGPAQIERVRVTVGGKRAEDCWVVGMATGTRAVSNCAPDPKPFVHMTDETKLAIHEYWAKKERESDGGPAGAGP